MAWINFKKLRAKLDFETVLTHYGIEVKRKGEQHQGFCPLPQHEGQKKSPSFSANLERGIFQCFGCGAKGNILEFAAMMENVDTEDGPAFRAVAGKLQERFCPDLGHKQKKPAPQNEQPKAARNLPVVVNAPLDFTLKGLDIAHPYLYGRGFTQETVIHFGLGFCSRGMLKDRIVIPLHDADGKLVGYAGRVVDDGAITEDNPRYRFPGARERGEKIFEFRKTLFLYNGCRIPGPMDDLVIVEGFASVWWLHQNGLRHVVATMGSDCSEEQAKLIVALVSEQGRVSCIPDADQAGERFAQSVLMQVSPHRFVRWVRLDEGEQPTDLSTDEIKGLTK